MHGLERRRDQPALVRAGLVGVLGLRAPGWPGFE